jgi:hypothetical protein
MSNVIVLRERASKPAPDVAEPQDRPEQKLLYDVRDSLLELSSGLTGLRRSLMKLHQRMLAETPQ